jgi:glycosyltransferase involved in cell wall biosynthesis
MNDIPQHEFATISIVFHRTLFSSVEDPTFIHPALRSYEETFKGKFRLRVYAIADRSYTGSHDLITVIVYKALPLLRDAFAFGLIADLIRDHSRLVIVHGLRHLVTLAALMVTVPMRKPVIVVNTGMYDKAGDNILIRGRDAAIFRLLRRRSVTLVSLTAFDQRRLSKRLRLDAAKSLYIPDWIDTTGFSGMEYARVAQESGAPTVLYVGRLEPEKRVEMLLESVSELRAQSINCRVLLVGDGSQRSSLIRQCRTLRIQDIVSFVGWVPHSEVRKYYDQSDILVLPSSMEALGRVIMESFVAGRPVIATDLPQIRELVHHGKTGFLFRAKEELTSSLGILLSNRDTLDSMKENAKRAGARFSDGRKGKASLELVERLTSESC